MKILSAILLAVGLSAAPAMADRIGNWNEQRFLMRAANTWTQSSQGVTLSSDAAASLIWAKTGDASLARWTWTVQTSVPPTSLTQKGRDDRNLAVFFVFLPPKLAQKHRNSGIQNLLNTQQARVLMYVWGGDQPRGSLLASPHMQDRGKIVVLRRAGTGAFQESVDLAADFTRAFGTQKTTLAGLAILSDSDDTKTAVRASLSDLQLD